MSKFPSENPPPCNQINNSVPQIQETPILQPVVTHQPVFTHQPVGQQQQQVVNTIQIVHTGNHCVSKHNFRSEFTCCGICCAIFLFPIGLICCFCMMKRRCKNCNLYA